MFDYQYDKEQIINELGIESMDVEFKAQVLTTLDTLLSKKMRDRVLRELSDEQTEEFISLESREEAQIFLREQLPTIETMYDEEFADIVHDMKKRLTV